MGKKETRESDRVELSERRIESNWLLIIPPPAMSALERDEIADGNTSQVFSLPLKIERFFLRIS